ncbi:hypothetical protein PUNSTDRAFT_48569 [Punctularia strigosozonata HHB-11173 SS5]|uniref:uncharacterized protein n=1 Tax=Punctularia strigosozonata (strain HHB-11173) TaxID=741275 RepID=UPI000441864B|nr:uncharacterized protein PUNSTDRAFT_48569 [Punctularia strigosozonata HHB-11173 SS5]EIN13630.1 hypothetical protein PUNSTDRAFT_48569 [Punctularia strigosozonata HHB-11173 SS5]
MKLTDQKPPRWPSHVEYIPSQVYDRSVPHELLCLIRGNQLCPPTRVSSVTIRPVTERSHPAFGQHGLFAAKRIPPRSHIIDYAGEVHADDRPSSDYDLSLHRTRDGISIGVDASRKGNEARFVNDYRGIRDRPNAVFQEGRPVPDGELRMSIWSSSECIRKGDEILVSYGKGWWQARLQSSAETTHERGA